MRALQDILNAIKPVQVQGESDVQIKDLVFDSRKASPQSLFFALEGTAVDGHKFIAQVLEKGTKAIVCMRLPETLLVGICYIVVKDSTQALAMASSCFYSNPSTKLKLVGVTGTNGKTTTATLLYNLFRDLGFKAGLLSTIRYCIDGQCTEATHTTPDVVRINSLLQEMVEQGCEFCFMEVSSHAIVQQRIEGLTFAGAIFTNITHDHLDYHKTFRAYIDAKKLFFDRLPATAFALVNTDDKNGQVMLQNTAAKKVTFGLKNMAKFHLTVLEHDFSGMFMQLDGQEFWTPFIGRFNAYNLLGVYAAAILLGQEQSEVLIALSALKNVDGRFDVIRSSEGISAIVDYAHTPDALENVLNTINEIRNSSAALITVVGAGGDRDKTKRPEMAKIAANQSTKVILTSDNPRSESPEDILADMQEGVPLNKRSGVLRITNRRDAIRTAVNFARSGDILLIAGKGHETYQEIKGVKHHFDDKEVIREIFAEIESTKR